MSTPAAFDIASAVTRRSGAPASGPVTFDVAYDPTWGQGAGAFGGLVAAQFVRAFTEVVAERERAVRTMTVHFAGPARLGRVSALHVEAVRAGRAVTHLTGRVVQTGPDHEGRERPDEVVALAAATCGLGRGVDDPAAEDFTQLAPPSGVPPFESLERLNLEAIGPKFTQHIDMRYAAGAPPFSGSDRASLAWWVAFRQAPARVGLSGLAATLDVPPPAVFSRAKRFRLAATTALTYHFFVGPDAADALEPASPRLVQLDSVAQRGGYSTQQHWVWTTDGTLLARGLQQVALIG